MKIVIDPARLRRDTFHCGGHGGQNINKVETGVRYTDPETGIAASACDERSQSANDQLALRRLVEKIANFYRTARERQRQKDYRDKPRAVRGNQRRTYWLCGHRRVVDHVTGTEGDPREVLDGKIDAFIVSAREAGV